MKKNKRKIPLVSPLKIAIAALYAAIATTLIFIFSGIDNEWFIICGGITASLFLADFMVIEGAGGRYRYSDKAVEVLYHSISYKRIEYSLISTIVISNASYNNGYGYGINGNIPMQYTVKGNNKHNKITFPFITLHKSQYPVDKIKKGMSSRDLFMLNSDKIYCLGICWFDSFQELLEYSNCSVYLLEDVYLRFKGQFDVVFSEYNGNLDRFYIISDRSITYQEYQEGKLV